MEGLIVEQQVDGTWEVTDGQVIIDAWLEAIRDAFMLARGERLSELRGGRRPRSFDDRGLHPYTLAWGRIWAYEVLIPALAEARLSDPMCDPVTLRRIAKTDAEGAFYDELTRSGPGAWQEGGR